MTLQVFTTGRGTPYGLATAPVVKVATRSDLAARWHYLIDLDAGRIATGEATVEEVGWELFRMILDVASGARKPWADCWRLQNDLTLFNSGPVTRAAGRRGSLGGRFVDSLGPDDRVARWTTAQINSRRSGAGRSAAGSRTSPDCP